MKKIIWALLLVLTISTSYYIGGVVGFRKGLVSGFAANAPSDAYSLSHAIKCIRRNEIDRANLFLRGMIDAKILEHWIVYRSGPSLFYVENFIYDDAFIFDKSSLALMKIVAEFKSLEQNPNYPEDNEVLIDALNYYKKIQQSAAPDAPKHARP